MKYLFSFLILLINLAVGLIVFQNTLSFKDQVLLTNEWGKEDKKIDQNKILSLNLNSPFVNITHTTLPISLIKATYTAEKNIDTTIYLLHKGIKENPFIGVSEYSLGQLYRKIKLKDSSLFYGKKSVELLPNYLHVSNYINSLQKFKQYKLADSVYNKYSEKFKDESGYHKPYLYNKILEKGPGNDSLVKYILRMKNKFNNEDYLDLYLQSKYGIESYSEAIVFYNDGNVYFERNNLEEALLNYKSAVKLVPEKWEYQENLGIIYSKLNNNDKAKIHLEMVYDSLNKKSSKSLFQAAILMLIDKDTVKACELLNRAKNLNHKGSISILNNSKICF